MRAHFHLRLSTTLLILTTIFSGCEEEPEPPVILPTGLTLELTEDPVIEGSVEAEASATNANFYTFIYEVDGEQTVLESADGTASFFFAESGTYEVTARAHTTYEDYIQITEEIEIEISDPIGNNGNPPEGGFESPSNYPGYTLTWSDEFNGTSLSSDWTFEIGTGSNGWGNQELQYYREENTSVEDGYLIIEAREEAFGGQDYTSSRIITEGNVAVKYGRIDIRAAMPYGQGLWPALWMLGASFDSIGWPRCGEIDIMEMVGGNVTGGGNDVVHGTVHWDQDGTKADFGGSRRMPEPLANNFHVYSIVWDSTQIEWYIDETRYHSIDITPAALSEFQEEFFFIFNVAVGGIWPGSPNAATVFPQRMYVDYVRVFQQ